MRPEGPAQLLAPLGFRAMQLVVGIEEAEAAGDARQQAALWLDGGDALVNNGRVDAAVEAWERGVAAAVGADGGRAGAGPRGSVRRVLSSLYWRLGQVAESQRALEAAESRYERAAELFHGEGDAADEAVARMAIARVRFHHTGAGLARPEAREAVRLASLAADPALSGEANELTSAIAFDLGDFEDARIAAREAIRYYREARDSQGEVRASIALSEVLLEAGALLQAVNALEPVEPLLEGVDSNETRGRGMALLARFQLEAGNIEAATAPMKSAQELFLAAGANLRIARFLLAVGRTLEKRSGGDPRAGIDVYKTAFEIVRREGDRLRLAPIAYAYARALHATRDNIRADEVIDLALKLTQEAGDLEGQAYCTELGVRIAVSLAQGPMALERMILLARTRARLGDHQGELRTLLGALEATLRVPDLDPVPLAEEFMECVRRTGTEHLGPSEAMEVAKRLVSANRPAFAAELAGIEGMKEEQAGHRSAAARTFAQAAFWALAAGQAADGLAFYERALALGEPLLLPETEMWRVERQILLDGR
ncbi:MAG: hypothetical protein U1F43_30795 [Myxococcota bacterium]